MKRPDILSVMNSFQEPQDTASLDAVISHQSMEAEQDFLSEEDFNYSKGCEDHKQLAKWLMELRYYRRAREEIVTKVQSLHRESVHDDYLISEVLQIVEEALPKFKVSRRKFQEFNDTVLNLWINNMIDDETYTQLKNKLENVEIEGVMEPTPLDRKVINNIGRNRFR